MRSGDRDGLGGGLDHERLALFAGLEGGRRREVKERVLGRIGSLCLRGIGRWLTMLSGACGSLFCGVAAVCKHWANFQPR